MTAEGLPLQPTTFVGRESELARIAQLLADPACRLLTVVGSGGIGKTRLALQAAANQRSRFAHGVSFVPLVSVLSPDRLATAIAAAIGIEFYDAANPQVQLVQYIHLKQLLLLLDSFEHLLGGTSLLSEMLQAAPGVKILITSRERLNLQEEWVLTLEGLPFPTDQGIEPLESYSAVQLFV